MSAMISPAANVFDHGVTERASRTQNLQPSVPYETPLLITFPWPVVYVSVGAGSSFFPKQAFYLNLQQYRSNLTTPPLQQDKLQKSWIIPPFSISAYPPLILSPPHSQAYHRALQSGSKRTFLWDLLASGALAVTSPSRGLASDVIDWKS